MSGFTIRIGVRVIIFFLLSLSFAYGADCEKAKTYLEQALNLREDLPGLIKKEQLYKKAIEFCSSYAEAHNNLGDVYEKQGRFEEAMVQYKKATELKPSFACPYFGLGDIYYKTNRPEEAIKWYEKGLKYDPNDTLTLKRLALLKDVKQGNVIKAGTIRGMFSATRAPGEVVSITFGEGLIPFYFDKYEIRADAKPQLDEIGKALKYMFGVSKDISIVGIDNTTIEIAGHTDIKGTDEYNQKLSENRAQSVINYLVKNFKISRDRLGAVGYGERKPLCITGETEACHALNRRVEIIKVSSKRTQTRGVSTQVDVIENKKLVMDVGFFYQRKEGKLVEILKEGTHLRSKVDRYFIFFRPLQDCYTYLLQEDASGRIDLLFPKKEGNDAYVKKDADYWVPGFGRAYTLDETLGEEKLYLVVTSWPLKSEIEGLTLKEQVRGAVKSLQTRIIKVVRPIEAYQQISEAELNNKPQKINKLLERVEGQGGWVKAVRFRHD